MATEDKPRRGFPLVLSCALAGTSGRVITLQETRPPVTFFVQASEENPHYAAHKILYTYQIWRPRA